MAIEPKAELRIMVEKDGHLYVNAFELDFDKVLSALDPIDPELAQIIRGSVEARLATLT